MIFRIGDQSQVGSARRAAATLARECGCVEADAGRVSIVATEMATNLLRHAGSGHAGGGHTSGGEIAMQRIADGEGDWLELVAFDCGPGIADTARAMEDGFSRAGSPGTGLGAIRRQADNFAIWSAPGVGTAVMARFAVARAPATFGCGIGVMVAPYPGEAVSGDAWSFAQASAGASMLVADGLGHGPFAAAAAGAAVACFGRYVEQSGVQIAEAIHGALRPTRGAAIAVARIDTAERLVRFVGIGNIAGAVISNGTSKRTVSHHGTAGHTAPRIAEFTYPYAGRPVVILHSDGLSAKWDLGSYPGLAASHPALIAAILFARMRRERDDACILVVRAPQ